MILDYEFKNEKLQKLVENKAQEINIDVEDLIWGYINRGLLDDSHRDEIFEHLHSREFLNEVNGALGLD